MLQHFSAKDISPNDDPRLKLTENSKKMNNFKEYKDWIAAEG